MSRLQLTRRLSPQQCRQPRKLTFADIDLRRCLSARRFATRGGIVYAAFIPVCTQIDFKKEHNETFPSSRRLAFQ